MPRQDETELFWQAFRYVGEEMTPAEAVDFEGQLADQQTAREAVARVVELSQLVLATAPEQSAVSAFSDSGPAFVDSGFVSPARQNRAWMQPVGWVAVGAAACLAVVMAYQSFAPTTGATQMASTPPASASDLAFAWNAANQSLANHAVDTHSTDAHSLENGVADANSEIKIHGPADLLFAGDENSTVDPSTVDPMEEFTDPVAPAWLLVAVEDAGVGASQEN